MIGSEELYHAAPEDNGDLVHADPFEYLQADLAEQEQAQRTTTDLILATDCTKDSIAAQVKYLVGKVHEGEVNALQAGVHINAVMKVCEEVREQIKQDVIAEVGKYGKVAEVYGTSVEVKEAGTKYDYAHCGDHVLQELTAKMDSLMADIKKRQAFLKTLTGSTTLVDEQTGEVYTVHPPRKTSTTTYAITHK